MKNNPSNDVLSNTYETKKNKIKNIIPDSYEVKKKDSNTLNPNIIDIPSNTSNIIIPKDYKYEKRTNYSQVNDINDKENKNKNEYSIPNNIIYDTFNNYSNKNNFIILLILII